MLRERSTPFIGRRRAAATVVLAYAGLVLGACGDSPHQSSAEIWCAAVCTAVQRCGYQCRPNCVAERPKLNNTSEAGAAAQQPCLSTLSCPAVGGDDAAWKAENQACWDQAKTSVAITPHVRDFCAGHALAWFNCGYNYPTDVCERSYGMWKDAVIDQVAICDAKISCAELQTCQDAVFANL